METLANEALRNDNFVLSCTVTKLAIYIIYGAPELAWKFAYTWLFIIKKGLNL